MRYILLAILFITVTWNTYSQVSNSKVVRIANATTSFSDPLSEGSLVIDLETDKCYLILQGVAGTNSLTDLTVNTDYKELTSLSELSVSNLTVDTLTADSVSLNALNYNDTYYDDFLVNPFTVKSSNTTTTDFRGVPVLTFPNNLDSEAFFTAQVPHSYKEGTDLKFHLHVVYSDTTDRDSVNWTFEYAWANINQAFPDVGSITKNTAPSGTTDYNTIASIGTLDGTGKRISSILICTLRRNTGVDTYDGNVYVLSIDFHMEIDAPGSSEVLTK